MSTESRIALLDHRLANQIAAGEVVERPASVVKELVENSLDSGANRIEVDIERGGARLIRITDNGTGIHKSDLGLALTRHATSKINSTDDLANIQSLGFRGEALASISSVSRLTLTSRRVDSDLAWQAIAQGRHMDVDIQPASAAVGTRIEVADLFFNTPARQKFLRTEKTEFSHIEEVFKRHALANFEVAFVLKHNHKAAKRVPACGESSQWLKRVGAICGKPFADNALSFECRHEAVRVWGWLGKPGYHRSESDIQFVFINRRPVKDRTLNHAIRQAYEDLIPPGRMATYVIYLEIDPQQVDVNVHPTKHEVRLSQQRLVHDLLAKSISEALYEQSTLLSDRLSTSDYQESSNGDHKRAQLFYSAQSLASSNQDNLMDIGEPEANVLTDKIEYVESLPSAVESSSALEFSVHSSAKPRINSPQPSSGVKKNPSGRESELEHYLSGTKDAHSAEASNLLPIHLGSEFWLYPEYQSDSGSGQSGFGQSGSDQPWSGQSVNRQSGNGQAFVINAEILIRDYLKMLLAEQLAVQQERLLFPLKIEVSNELLENFACHQLLQCLGFDTKPHSSTEMQINQVPVWGGSLARAHIADKVPEWMKMAADDSIDNERLVSDICKSLRPYTPQLIQSIAVLPHAELQQSKGKKLLEKALVVPWFEGRLSCPLYRSFF